MSFINNFEFEQWHLRLQLSQSAITIIERIRSSPPSRNVKGKRSNVTGRVPVKSMDFTIQTESRTTEKPGMRSFYEYDTFVRGHTPDEVIEFYDQPDSIKLDYLAASGRRNNVDYTPDFFVIRHNSAGWEEWKTEEELEKLSVKQPNRYVRSADGGWRCPPGEAYAVKYGLYFKLRSSKEINWNVYSNLEFLHDYLVHPDIELDPDISSYIRKTVIEEQGIELSLLLMDEIITADDVYHMIAQQELYIDLTAARLSDIVSNQSQVRVFTSKSAFVASDNLASHAAQYIDPSTLQLNPGALVMWDGERWKVLNLGGSCITLQHDVTKQMTELSKPQFEDLLQKKTIIGLDNKSETAQPHPEVLDIQKHATDEDYKIANYKLIVLQALNDGLSINEAWEVQGVREVLGDPRTPRAIRSWKKNYSEAQKKWGNGYIGLIPSINDRGNRNPKVSKATIEFTESYIKDNVEILSQPILKSVWVRYKTDCEDQSLDPVSLPTFNKMAKNRPIDERTFKRKGQRAASQVEKKYWYLTNTTPKHGERAWHIVHIDHTQLDIQLRHSTTGKNLGRPWATIATDAFTRRILAVSVSYDSNPSYRNCMMILREILKRFNRLPQIIYVDNGKEFHSTYFQTLAAMYGVEVNYRPSGKPRYGDVSERLFNTSNKQLIHNLTGNTQISKDVRLMTKSNNPENHAIWDLGSLKHILQKWAYEIYDQTEHFSLGETPRQAFERSLLKGGYREMQTWIDYDNFCLNALPAPHGKATRRITSHGFKHANIYYWHDCMYSPAVMNQNVKVRYDPFDAGIAYAYIRGEWVKCTSEYYAVFKGRTEKEIADATEELKAGFRRHSRVTQSITARRLAVFLQEKEQVESSLFQRLREQENKRALQVDDYRSLFLETSQMEKPENLKQALEEGGENPLQTSDIIAPITSIRPVSHDKYDHLEEPKDL